MSKRVEILGESLVRIFNKMIENQKIRRKYGLDELLYPAEIHTIMMIGERKNSGVSGLARKAGITKGAVSQMVNRLENKGLIKKYRHPDNSKRVILDLTNKGKVAFFSHKRLHEETDRKLYAYLNMLKEKEITVLEEFLRLLEQGIEKRGET